MSGWMTKADPLRKAHFLLEDGTTACSHVLTRDGRPMSAPFKTPFIAFDEWSHLCTTCRRLHGGVETYGMYPEADGYRVRLEFIVDEASYASFMAWVRAQRGGGHVSTEPPRREPAVPRRLRR